MLQVTLKHDCDGGVCAGQLQLGDAQLHPIHGGCSLAHGGLSEGGSLSLAFFSL